MQNTQTPTSQLKWGEAFLFFHIRGTKGAKTKAFTRAERTLAGITVVLVQCVDGMFLQTKQNEKTRQDKNRLAPVGALAQGIHIRYL